MLALKKRTKMWKEDGYESMHACAVMREVHSMLSCNAITVVQIKYKAEERTAHVNSPAQNTAG